MADKKQDRLDQEAIAYHQAIPHGKLQISTTKPLSTPRDLSLAYSPGVAAVSRAIAEDPAIADITTSRGNLVAVISNGTAVLGLGNIGPLASKPVMEGKAALFKSFAGIDVFDLEVDALKVDRFCDIVAALEPTFCGINLEDIRAPECFEIERILSERMNIPVFHDDQHGTAICVAASVINGLEIVEKEAKDVKVVCSGAGAAALACLHMLESIGIRRKNITVVDIDGIVTKTRKKGMDKYKAIYAIDHKGGGLGDVIAGADIFLGLSAPNVLKPEYLKNMARDPLIFAMANPDPEILPEVALQARPDAIVGTGRSDYPNQINNVLCFPFIFRGALDVRATTINKEMKVACAHGIAALARRETTDTVSKVYGKEDLAFGRDYLIPKPFDVRLMIEVAPAVAQAAMDSGVARQKIEDMEQYRKTLTAFVFRSGTVMQPIFAMAKRSPLRVALADGEDRRVLQAVQTILDERLAELTLIGRREVVESRIEQIGLRIRPDRDFRLVDPQDDPQFREYWQLYHAKMGRRGVTPEYAKTLVRTRNTIIGALMVDRGDADALLCGLIGQYDRHLRHIHQIIGCSEQAKHLYSLGMIIVDSGPLFMGDCHVNDDLDVDQLLELTDLGIDEIRQLGIAPKVGFVCSSNFGSSAHSSHNSSKKMARAASIAKKVHPGIAIEGEMRVDTAFDPELRETFLPDNDMKGAANFLVMPNVDAANIGYNLCKTVGDGQTIGPLLLGTRLPAHIMSMSVTARGVVNMVAIAVVDAQNRQQKNKL
ncbi:MAG: NADP-dependent malic enzyme [Pseudomonadota bacterium]